MEHKILASHLSTTSDLRQRRQKAVTSDLKCEASGAGDKSSVEDTIIVSFVNQVTVVLLGDIMYWSGSDIGLCLVLCQLCQAAA